MFGQRVSSGCGEKKDVIQRDSTQSQHRGRVERLDRFYGSERLKLKPVCSRSSQFGDQCSGQEEPLSSALAFQPLQRSESAIPLWE